MTVGSDQLSVVSKEAGAKSMAITIVIWLLTTILLATVSVAEAQQPKKVPRIGYLSAASASFQSFRTKAFGQGLRELGYVEEKNIVIEWPYAEGKHDRLPALAAELVRLNVDVIVAGGNTVIPPVKEATSTIPIVMTQASDPVASGFIASLARPGGNITGLSSVGTELSGKRLELLKETVPRLSRLAVLGTSTSPNNVQDLRERRNSPQARSR
jgi:ABC-type uncharacterized transport system substrate-binding protein